MIGISHTNYLAKLIFCEYIKSLDYEEIKLEPQIEGGLLDSSKLVIVGLGAVYFLFKKFTK